MKKPLLLSTLVCTAILWQCKKLDYQSLNGNEQSATFETLGVLDSSEQYFSNAVAISDDGEIVVGNTDGYRGNPWGIKLQGFRWQGGNMEVLYNENNSSLIFVEFLATDISGDGSVIIGYGRTQSFHGWKSQGLHWEKDTITVLGGDGVEAKANGVSRDGSIITGYDSYRQTCYFPCYWKNSLYHSLDVDNLQANATGGVGGIDVSGDGNKMIGSRFFRDQNGEIKSEYVIWKDTVPRSLSDFLIGSDFTKIIPHAISEDGTTIIGTGVSSKGSEGFYLKNNQIYALDESTNSDLTTVPLGVSSDGSVIVGTAKTTEAKNVAFIWTKDKGITNLEDYIKEKFTINTGEWILTSATCVSANGKVIAGNAISKNNPDREVAWRIKTDELL